MTVSRFFIDRPILATVLSIVITIVGAIAFGTLPLAQYPEVVPPTIVVSASYPGANAQVVAATVATPLEQEINGVEDMLYMSSQSTNDGSTNVTITFRLGTDLDKAQVLVQNRVAIALARLPEEVRRVGVVTRKSSPDLLMVVHMLSPSGAYDQLYISNYAILQVRDAIARVDGVGDVTIMGAREYSMRVWLDPERIAALGMTAGDVISALREQNVQVAAGVLGQQPAPAGTSFELAVSTTGRLVEPEQFDQIVVKTGEGGRITRLREVARVELGARDYSINSYLSGKKAVALLIAQRPGSNALATAERVRASMEELAADFPTGLEYQIVYDPTRFIDESISDVIQTLFEAILLVVFVVVLFLQSWRSSLIPLVAIPVSLVGTFAAMAAFGFSLNNLSLFGLVLAIGIVVDDAIVVVENVERNLQRGLDPREAARLAMDEVGSAVVAASLVLGAVFIPTAFVPGIAGQFYRQFAVTIAISTFISLFVSLTLTPALCGLLLRGHDAPRDRFTLVWERVLGGFFRGFDRVFEAGRRRYAALVERMVGSVGPWLAAYGVLLLAAFALFRFVPVGFIPDQDQGYVIIAIQLPDAASLERTDAVTQEVSRIALETEGVVSTVQFVGFSGATRTNSSNAAAIFVTLAPFEERDAKGLRSPVVMNELRRRLAVVRDGFVVVIPPPPVQGLGTAGGYKLYVQDRRAAGYDGLQAATDALVGAGNQDARLRGLFTTFRAGAPQLFAEIDRAKAKMLDVPLGNVFEALQVYLGSVYVNDFNLLGRTFQVRAQAESRFRIDESTVGQLKTRNARGDMVPLGSLLELRRISGPGRVVHYNLYPAAEINGDVAPGISSGQGLETVAALAKDVLPPGFGFEWTDLAYQQRQVGNVAIFVFALSVLFVFLLLAAQFESWSLPLSIILIVPMCLLFAMLGVLIRGLSNDLLVQIGLIVLVALAAKNAILIVEFANQRMTSGEDARRAAIEACRLRLRPILMTSFAFILGVVPLMTASGAGAEMRQSLGTAVFSGMLGVTLFGLFLTPIFFVAIRGRGASASPPSGAEASHEA
ncbi:multidrug efflux RND transporter permease subunit [Myxococcota bacterium]|nr:multidrug efflux RND transporter permease subunit [Myxococcota bacterium]